MRTNYAGHEATYRKLRRDPARKGWNSPEQETRLLGLLDAMFQWPGVPASGRLLELGCGAGTMSIHLAARGWEVHGVDIAPTAIEWAIQNAASAGVSASFAVGDVLALDTLADGQFDVVLDGHCLHCIVGPDRRRFYDEAFRVLKPGGKLLLSMMCGEVPPCMRDEFDEASRCLITDGVAGRYIGLPADLLAEPAGSGFVVERSAIEPALDERDVAELFVLASKPVPAEAHE